MKLKQIKYIILIICLFCFSCQDWVDNQLEALECWSEQLGQVICKDRKFYICPLSLRWQKIVECDDLSYEEYYNIECCMED